MGVAGLKIAAFFKPFEGFICYNIEQDNNNIDDLARAAAKVEEGKGR